MDASKLEGRPGVSIEIVIEIPMGWCAHSGAGVIAVGFVNDVPLGVLARLDSTICVTESIFVSVSVVRACADGDVVILVVDASVAVIVLAVTGFQGSGEYGGVLVITIDIVGVAIPVLIQQRVLTHIEVDVGVFWEGVVARREDEQEKKVRLTHE